MLKKVAGLVLLASVASIGAAQERKPSLAILPILHVRHVTQPIADLERRQEMAYEHLNRIFSDKGFSVVPLDVVERSLERLQIKLETEECVTAQRLKAVQEDLGSYAVAALCIDYSEKPYLPLKNGPRGTPSIQTLVKALTSGSPNHTRLGCSTRTWLYSESKLWLDGKEQEVAAGEEDRVLKKSIDKSLEPFFAATRKAPVVYSESQTVRYGLPVASAEEIAKSRTAAKVAMAIGLTRVRFSFP